MIPRVVSKWEMSVGLGTIFLTFWGATRFLDPFYSHTYPLAWYGLILFLDGVLWWRWNEGLIFERPFEFVTLLFWSAVLWFFFEVWNLRIENWYYVGVSSGALWPHIEAYLDFATVLPGMFLVYRLLVRIQIPRRTTTRTRVGENWRVVFLLVGLTMLALPLAFPDYFFPLVWGAFLFLFEPLLAKKRGPSLLNEAERGEWTAFVRLLLAGLLCGGYWELCNYWSLAKWIYTVPFFSQGKLFEMPYLGFLGFPPFCVQCYVMINAVYVLRSGRHWDIGIARSLPATSSSKTLYVLAVLLGLVLSEWSYARLNRTTIDSRVESAARVIEDISREDADRLEATGWRYPKHVLRQWENVGASIAPAKRVQIRERLELAGLLQMGSASARLMEHAGVRTLKQLAAQDPEHLFPRLVEANEVLQIRKTPLFKRRVVAWINGARRVSVFY
jgi:hypothetical protein